MSQLAFACTATRVVQQVVRCSYVRVALISFACFCLWGAVGFIEQDGGDLKIGTVLSYRSVCVSNSKTDFNKELSCRWQTVRCLLAWFFDFYLPLSQLTPSIPSSYRVHIWYGKTRTAGLQSGESRMMIDSVAWIQHISVTDMQFSCVAIPKATPTHWRRAAKTPLAKRSTTQFPRETRKWI